MTISVNHKMILWQKGTQHFWKEIFHEKNKSLFACSLTENYAFVFQDEGIDFLFE